MKTKLLPGVENDGHRILLLSYLRRHGLRTDWTRVTAIPGYCAAYLFDLQHPSACPMILFRGPGKRWYRASVSGMQAALEYMAGSVRVAA